MSLISISFGSSSPRTSPHMTIITGLVVALVAGIVLFFLNWFREWITGHLQKRRRAKMLGFLTNNSTRRTDFGLHGRSIRLAARGL